MRELPQDTRRGSRWRNTRRDCHDQNSSRWRCEQSWRSHSNQSRDSDQVPTSSEALFTLILSYSSCDFRYLDFSPSPNTVRKGNAHILAAGITRQLFFWTLVPVNITSDGMHPDGVMTAPQTSAKARRESKVEYRCDAFQNMMRPTPQITIGMPYWRRVFICMVTYSFCGVQPRGH